MRTFICDLETYSSVDLKTAGPVKYAEAEDFELLLMSYAFDDEPVTTWDIKANGVPDWLRGVLLDPDVLKVAWNIGFERACFNAALGLYTPPEQWRDAMPLAAMNGLPMTLEAAGAALHLEEQKLSTGKSLIAYFCKPCKPTLANGGRTRNLPEHAPEKWAQFKLYNGQDVVAERTIRNTLLQWKPSEIEHRFWCLDARINEKGMRIDPKLAINAVAMDRRYKEELTSKAHAYELSPCASTVVCVDALMAGIGSNSCGPELLDKYRPGTKITFSYTLIPQTAE